MTTCKEGGCSLDNLYSMYVLTNMVFLSLINQILNPTNQTEIRKFLKLYPVVKGTFKDRRVPGTLRNIHTPPRTS